LISKKRKIGLILLVGCRLKMAGLVCAEVWVLISAGDEKCAWWLRLRMAEVRFYLAGSNFSQ